MKKLVSALVVVISCMVAFSSCSSIFGKKIQMDSAEAIQAVKDVVKKNIDLTTYKITQISWSEKGGSDKLENILDHIWVSWVDKDNKTYLQCFSQKDGDEFIGDKVENGKTDVYYEFVKGIDVDKLDDTVVSKQIDEARPTFEEEYDVQSLANYTISEETMSMLTKSLREKYPFFKGHNPNEYGKHTIKFVLNLLKKGEKKEVNGRLTTTHYYAVPFTVDEDGKVQSVD